jgi:hypothetical protein
MFERNSVPDRGGAESRKKVSRLSGATAMLLDHGVPWWSVPNGHPYCGRIRGAGYATVRPSGIAPVRASTAHNRSPGSIRPVPWWRD